MSVGLLVGKLMGRKAARLDGKVRVITYPVRFASDEYEAVKAKAEKSGLTACEFIRRSAIGRQIRSPKSVPEINRSTYHYLGNVANNLNQLVKALNTAVKNRSFICNSDAEYFERISQRLTATIAEVQSQLLGVEGEEDDS